MSKKLWDYFDGEPFMVNPRLGVLNPKKRGKKMATRIHRRGKKRAAKSSPRPRKNAWINAAPVINRKRRSGRKASPRRGKSRRNPPGMSIMGFSIPPTNQVLFAGVGFIAPPMVEGFVSRFLPTDLQTSTFGKYAIRIVSVIGLTWVVRQFIGAPEARMTAIGGSVYVLAGAVTEFVPGLIPGMGMYVPANNSNNSLGMYVDATRPTHSTLGDGNGGNVSDLFSSASGRSAGAMRSYIRR